MNKNKLVLRDSTDSLTQSDENGIPVIVCGTADMAANRTSMQAEGNCGIGIADVYGLCCYAPPPIHMHN